MVLHLGGCGRVGHRHNTLNGLAPEPTRSRGQTSSGGVLEHNVPRPHRISYTHNTHHPHYRQHDLLSQQPSYSRYRQPPRPIQLDAAAWTGTNRATFSQERAKFSAAPGNIIYT